MQLTSPGPRPQSPKQPAATSTTMLAGLLSILAGLGSLPLLGVYIPLWIQPSLVGLLWGSLFLIGSWLTFASHCNWFNLALVVGGSVSLTFAFHSITDLTIEESILVAVTLVACGWLAFRFDPSPKNTIARLATHSNGLQIPLIDLFVAMTLVACTARAITQMTSPPIMLIGIMGTLIVGCCCCWAAYHWAWNDDRPIGAPLVAVFVLASLGIATAYRFSALSALELLRWLLQGPLSVIAAQCFTVLVVLAIMRWKIRIAGQQVASL